VSEDNRRLWLIDGAYMWYAQNSLVPAYQLDYRKLRDKLEEDGKVFQAYYFNATQNPPSDAQDSFHTWLKCARPSGPNLQVRLYKLKELHLKCPACSHEFDRQVQKGVDVGIATMALRLVDRYETLMLSSGDGDYMDSMEYVRNTLDKRLELVVFRYGVATDLQSLSDKIYWIDDFKQDVGRYD